MANNFGLFFARDDIVIRLPVNPETLPLDREGDNTDYNVLGIGEIIVPRLPKCRTFEIKSYFPGRSFPGVLTPNDFKSPEFYIDFFESALRDRAVIVYSPVRYYEDGTPFMAEDMGFNVVIDSFSTEEKGGETGDFYYTLSFTEYRDYRPQQLIIQTGVADTSAGAGGGGGGAESETSAAALTEVEASAQESRTIPDGQLYVGCRVVANGDYYYTSYKDEPHGSLSGREVVVSRIVDMARPCPVHVTKSDGGALGWMKSDALAVVKDD